MSAIRLVLPLLILGGIIVFLLQNWSPVLPLVFFGTQTVALPLAVWILLFTLAGVLTSACLQVLNYRPRSRNNASFREIESEEPPLPRPPGRETTVSGSRGAESSFSDRSVGSMPSPPPPPPRQTTIDSDWIDDREEDDWDLEQPPTPPTTPTSVKTPQSDSRSYEVKKQPKNISRAGSVYSYSYRDKDQIRSAPSEEIVDAKYRVITPPLNENTYEPAQRKPEKYGDEEDWGLDEDELENFNNPDSRSQS